MERECELKTELKDMKFAFATSGRMRRKCMGIESGGLQVVSWSGWKSQNRGGGSINDY